MVAHSFQSDAFDAALVARVFQSVTQLMLQWWLTTSSLCCDQTPQQVDPASALAIRSYYNACSSIVNQL